MKLFCSKCSSVFSVEAGDSAVVNCPQCNEEISRPESELAPGVVIGDFQIERSLSKGGMGEVFQARQISLDRQVALKILQKEYTEDRDYVASLFREARAAAKISHPNIVQAYAVGQDEGFYYFAMELVRGDTLKNILRKEGALEAKNAAKIINDVAKALDIAWREQKLVHQDIKPDNIMVDVNGFSKLADLGLAKTASLETVEDENAEEVLGTPQYISPEQLTGVPTDVRSDIYSLGATFYHIVTGQLPYRATDLMELARMHDAGNLTAPKEIKADVPEEVSRIIVKMMARNIDNRYQTPAELSADLERFLNKSDSDDFDIDDIVLTTRSRADESNVVKSSLSSDGGIKLQTPGQSATEAPALKSPSAPKLSAPKAPALKSPSAPKLSAPKAPAPKAPALKSPSAPKLSAPKAPAPKAPAPKAPAPKAPALKSPSVPKAPAAPGKTEKTSVPAEPVLKSPVAPKTPSAPKSPAAPGIPGAAPGMPGAAGGVPRPGMPGVAPGMPGVAPGIPGAAPGMPGGVPRPGMPAGQRPGTAKKSEPGFWEKNKKSLILLIILCVIGAGIGGYHLWNMQQQPAASGSSSGENSESGEDNLADPEAVPGGENGEGSVEEADEASADAESSSEAEVKPEALDVPVVSDDRNVLERDYANVKIDLPDRQENDGSGAEEKLEFISSEATYKKYELPDLSRQEYLDRARKLIEWRISNQDKNEEFLAKVDEEWDYLRYPVSDKEYALLNEVMGMFSGLDERYRCAGARAKMRVAHLAKIEEDKKRQDEFERRGRLDREALLRDKQEQERQEAGSAKLKAEADKQNRAHLNSINAEVDRLLINCLVALHEGAVSGDDKKLKQEIAKAEIFIKNEKTFTADEKKAIMRLQGYLKRMPAERAALNKVFSRFFTIKPRHNIRLLPEKGSTVLLVQVKPGYLVCQDNDKKEVIIAYKKMSPRTRQTWLAVIKKSKIANAEFYSDLLHLKKPDPKLIPKGFWKELWPLVEKGML